MNFLVPKNLIFRKIFLLCAVWLSAGAAFVETIYAKAVTRKSESSPLGVVRGVVRDAGGNPLSNAVVMIFREGNKLVRDLRSAADGSFSARLLAGNYIVAAAAKGFSPEAQIVQLDKSAEISSNFQLVRVGGGDTLPEKRIDRSDSKWRIRANANRRTIFQNNEGEDNVAAVVSSREETESETQENESRRLLESKSEVETYFASTDDASFVGVNFATIQPINDRLETVLAGQINKSSKAPQRIEIQANYRASKRHQLNFRAGGTAQSVLKNERRAALGQINMQVYDEWRVKNGVIIVLGLNYSRFVGASNAQMFAPRLGLQFQTDAKTRVSAGFSTRASDADQWRHSVEMENSEVIFRRPQAPTFSVVDEKVLMPKMRRAEIGVERVLDNDSSIEATGFFDLTSDRGVAMTVAPRFFGASEGVKQTLNQSGSAQGVRLIYNRRISDNVQASVGYAFGRGQKLNPLGNADGELLVNDIFQTLSAQISADLTASTNIKTIFRLSPKATVFAIDPFDGRLAIYDPSLSVLVTQGLPTYGLPFKAKAVVDARNLFDFQISGENDTSIIRLNNGRSLSGGIAVRF